MKVTMNAWDMLVNCGGLSAANICILVGQEERRNNAISNA